MPLMMSIQQHAFLYYIKQVDSMLLCFCPVIDHRGHQNLVSTPVRDSPYNHNLMPSVIYC